MAQFVASQIYGRKVSTGLNVITVIAMTAFHVGAVAAFFFIDWGAIAAAVALWYVSGSLGIGMAYHRLLTHRGYKTTKWMEYFLTICGTLALEGGPISWVATHRIHHQHSDQPGDPHSPRDGAWWAHVGWMLFGEAVHNNTKLMSKYAPDLAKERFYVWLNNYHYVPLAVVGVAMLMFGGVSMFLWAICLRVTLGLHFTWLVNSATHMWGYRNYETSDNSRNLWWVGILAFGEGWHNNHHAYQRVARQGHRWWEIDVTYWCIWLMEKVGLAWDVIRVKDIPKGMRPA